MDSLTKTFGLAFVCALALAFTGCNNGGDARNVDTDVVDLPYSASGDKDKKMPQLTFEVTEASTGKILQGEVRSFNFPFKNTGNAPLVISNVSASCGCTVPRNYPTGKIMPGESGNIEVEYDSQSKWGEQVSVISITANTLPNRTELIIRAHIVAPNQP